MADPGLQPLRKIANLPLVPAVLLALGVGALLPLSLAPLNLWPLALLSPPLLAVLLPGRSLRQTLILSYAFGFGLFAVGASWVWVSMHEFGNASVPLATLLTTVFVAFLAAVFCLPFALLAVLHGGALARFLLLFCCVWVLGEWLRSWLLTGFPWLFLGYSQLSTPLSGWAPVAGVFGVSMVTAVSACCGVYLVGCRQWHMRLGACAVLLLLFGGGHLGHNRQWTHPSADSIQVALVQPNIPQEKKWQPDFLWPTLERLQHLSEPLWEADWVVWPEAAIPLLYQQALPFLDIMSEQAEQTDTALISGILFDSRSADADDDRVYNSLIGLGRAEGIYHKTRLVPFGEYVPLEAWLRGLIDFFNLPMSVISAGDDQQTGLSAGSQRLAAALCYEIVYPDLVARNSRERMAIITVSNDAWFGHSFGPLQHLQMAQMRALETGRYVIRATNNGVSALIDPGGQLIIRSPQFQHAAITGEIFPMAGTTPFMRYGSSPLICVLFAVVTGAWLRNRRRSNGWLKSGIR